MTRQSLQRTRNNTDGSAFFPAFQKEMNRFLNHFRSGLPMMEDEDHPLFSEPSFPAIDVVETDDAFDISAEVPGVKEEDLDVTVSGSTLVLKGEKSAEHEQKDERYLLIERRYGSFRRHIPLGFTPEEGAVEAQFTDGILKLHIAKPATAKASVQKVDIKKS